MQSASATRPGLVNNTTQTMSGAKTFSTSISTPLVTGTTSIKTPQLLDNGAGLLVQTSSNQDLTLQTQNAGRFKLRGGEGVDFEQISTPSNPTSGFDTLYFKTDDNLYYKTSSGSEKTVDTINRISAPVISSSSGAFSTANTSYTAVTNLSVNVTSNVANEVWEIYCQSDSSTNFSTVGIQGGSTNDNSVIVGIFRGATEIATYQIRNFQGTAGGYNQEPASSIRFTDINPPTGSNTYSIKIYALSSGGSDAILQYATLVARQVKF